MVCTVAEPVRDVIYGGNPYMNILFKSLMAATFCWSAGCFAYDGREIAVMVDTADTSSDAVRDAVMVIQRGDQKLIRKMTMQMQKKGEDGGKRHSLITFTEPKDIQDTRFLSKSYGDLEHEKDLWVFLPAESLVRRISGGGRKNAFMRSDFSLEDLEYRSVDEDSHRFIAEDRVNDRPVWIIESVPVESRAGETGYAKRVLYVDQEYKSPVKVDYYNKQGRHIKTLMAGAFKNIQGIWTPTKLIMTAESGRGRTLLQYTGVTYNSGLPDEIFEQTSLKR